MRFVKYLFYSTAIIFPLGQLASLTVPAYPEIRIYLLDVLVGVTVGVWILLTLLTPNDPLRETPGVFKSILLFIGVAFVSLIVNAGNYELHQVVIGSLYLIRFVAYAGLYFVVRDLLEAKLLNRSKLSFILVAVGVISAMFGIIQYFLYPNLRNLKYLGWDPHLYRAFGTFLDPQFLGVVLVLTLIFLITQIRQVLTDKTDNNRIVFMASVITVFTALLLTYSRSSYLALGVGLGVYGLMRKRWRRVVSVVVALLLVIWIIPKPRGVSGNLLRTETMKSRLQSWREAIEIWQEKPVLGVGFNMLRYARGSKAAPLNVGRFDTSTSDIVSVGVSRAGAGIDNSFLFVLATAGITGLFAYLNIWRLILMSFVKKPSNFATAICITVALFIHACFNNTLFYPWVMWWVWVFFARFNVFYSSSGS